MPRKALTQDLAGTGVRFPRINANQTTDELTAAQMLTALGGVPGRDIALAADVVLGGALTVAAGEIVRLIGEDSHVLTVTSLTIAAGGVLDLGKHNLLIKNGGTASLAALKAHRLAGRLVNNTGDPAYGMAICYNSEVDFQLTAWPNSGVSTVALNYLGDGSTPTPTASDTFVAYALLGDANLDGVVDASDLGVLDFYAGSPLSPQQWMGGDFNDNGVLDNDDYQLCFAGLAPTKEFRAWTPRGTPTVVANASLGNGLGAGGSASIVGNDSAMSVTLTTDAAGVPVANHTLATITLSHDLGSAPKVLLMPANDAAWALVGLGAARVRQADVTTTTFTIRSGPTPFPATTAATYVFNILTQR